MAQSKSDDAVERIFRTIRSFGLSLGQFLSQVFSPTDRFGSPTTHLQITNFLHNNTTLATRPASIFDLIYRHPRATQYPRLGGRRFLLTSYSNLPAYSKPPKDIVDGEGAGREGLEVVAVPPSESCSETQQWCRGSIDEWTLSVVLGNVDKEADLLAENKFDFPIAGRNVSWT